MEEEHSLIIDIVGDESEVPQAEVSVTSSLSEDSSLGGSGDDAEAEVEDIIVVDPRESARSYDFRPSTVTVGCIRQLESLGYFVEGTVCEPGDETVPEPADEETIVFEEFFCCRASDATSSGPYWYFG
jgi:hypothetical protein